MESNKFALNNESGSRRKKMYRKICEQMEFYFSDSNLARDKFMKDMLDKSTDGYVDLQTFMTFNKIKNLCTDFELLTKAVSKSPILELSEDMNKVRRLTPIGSDRDLDTCTIYVEKLPSHANVDWLKSIFNKFGEVTYVSVPRFKYTNQPKGYAFVEFGSEESVIAACEHFKTIKEKTSEENIYAELGNESIAGKPTKKRKCTAEEIPVKKIKHQRYSHNQESDVEIVPEIIKVSSEIKDQNGKSLEQMLRVISKSEFKVYRNQYLSLLRATNAYLKDHVFNQMSTVDESAVESASNKAVTASPAKGLQFQPNVILKILTAEPIADVTEFKTKIKALANVAYIDANMESSEAHIRCATSEDATNVIVEKKLQELGSTILLTGDEEKTYWNKILEDRRIKFCTSTAHKRKRKSNEVSPSKRGSQKKHIIYND